jgi:hypothetical protein
MILSLIEKLSLVTKAGLAIFALAAITVGILANIHSVKDVKAGAQSYPLSAVVENPKAFEQQDVMVRGTLYSHTQGVLFLKGLSSNGFGEDRMRIIPPGNYSPSEELQTLLDDLQTIDANNEYKTVEVIVLGHFRDKWSRQLVITNIQPLSDITSKFFLEEICPIHNQIFEKNFLSLRYTIFEQSKNFHREFLKAKISLFPNSQLISDVTSRRDRCGLEFWDYSPEVSYCRMCKDAELKWVKVHSSGGVSF